MQLHTWEVMLGGVVFCATPTSKIRIVARLESDGVGVGWGGGGWGEREREIREVREREALSLTVPPTHTFLLCEDTTRRCLTREAISVGLVATGQH